jgi:hypothetical protein
MFLVHVRKSLSITGQQMSVRDTHCASGGTRVMYFRALGVAVSGKRGSGACI